jgi:hypothetical protein
MRMRMRRMKGISDWRFPQPRSWGEPVVAESNAFICSPFRVPARPAFLGRVFPPHRSCRLRLPQLHTTNGQVFGGNLCLRTGDLRSLHPRGPSRGHECSGASIRDALAQIASRSMLCRSDGIHSFVTRRRHANDTSGSRRLDPDSRPRPPVDEKDPVWTDTQRNDGGPKPLYFGRHHDHARSRLVASP